MPLQNRVDPWGTIFRTPARGAMLGNRGGALHNDQREIVRAYTSRRWIACRLEFKGRHRVVMSPRRYTELFFLDEAVAFAAGHRPCAECRRARYNAFLDAWKRRRHGDAGPPCADAVDLELHRARLGERGTKVTWQAPLDSLPKGSFMQLEASAWLVWDDALFLWTPAGYARKEPRPAGATVTVLTPRPIVDCFREGYEPETHSSRLAL